MVGKRDQIIQELDRGLSHLEQQESSFATRSAGLLTVTTVAVTVIVALRQNKVDPPVALIIIYVLLALVSCVNIVGRRLVDPALNADIRRRWVNLTEDEVYEVLFDVKCIALRVNMERVAFVRFAFKAHLCLVAATLVTAVLILWRQT